MCASLCLSRWEQVETIAVGDRLLVSLGGGLWREAECVGFSGEGDHPQITRDHPNSAGDHRVIAGDFEVIANVSRPSSPHAAAQRRYKAKCKALGRPYGTLRQPAAAAGERVRTGDLAAAPQEEEREETLSLAYDARASGPPPFLRKERWCSSVVGRAAQAGMLSTDRAAALYRELMALRPDPTIPNWGLSRRANDELDALDRQLRARVPPQPTLALPPVLVAAAEPETGPPAAPRSPGRGPGRFIAGRWYPDAAFAREAG